MSRNSTPATSANSTSSLLKILVIRRDNIGDLVCTTPMFHALREHFPTARVYALVNSYNAPVLAGNPDVDKVFSYTKAKHRKPGQNLISLYFDRIRFILKLRHEHLDYVILAGPGFQVRSLRTAQLLKPRHIIGFAGQNGQASQIDHPITLSPAQGQHESEIVFQLLAPLGINIPPPAARVIPDQGAKLQVEQALKARKLPAQKMLVGIHISARKPSQRWPAISFVELIKHLHQLYGASFLLLWSPGDSTNPLHPGDDAKAKEIMEELGDIPVLAYSTKDLGQLIGALSLCDTVICGDGGAMHLAAGLDKPILCFFGKSDAQHWHPWCVPYILLQPPSMEVADITVKEALNGFDKLLELVRS